MDTNELVNTSVMIAGRNYSLKIKPSDEPVIKQIVKEINEKLSTFSTAYTKKDKQDCLALVLLSFAVDLHHSKTEQPVAQALGPDVTEKIQHIDTLLDELLAPSQV